MASHTSSAASHTTAADEAQRYSVRNILRSEWIYGHGFQSPGGKEGSAAWYQSLNLNLSPEHRVLDIGSGLGGFADWIATETGCKAVGVDVSESMHAVCLQRFAARRDQISFVLSDCMDAATFEPQSFDVIFSKDCFLYVHDKSRLLANIQRWLKPGGVLAFTDFGTTPMPTDESFLHHVAECNYALETAEGYERLLLGIGFADIKVTDNTADFLTRNKTDLHKFLAREHEFLSDGYTMEDRDYIVGRWMHKIRWSEIGHLTQYAVVCVKPTSL